MIILESFAICSISGVWLGWIAVATLIKLPSKLLHPNRDLYLDGNHLECEGVIELIKLFADTAEMEAIERIEKKELTAEGVPANTLAVPPVTSTMSTISRPSSSVSLKSKPGR